MTIIGGSDGPTKIFLSGMSWLNWFGLIIVALMLIPNIIWAIRHRGEQNKCKNRTMNILEQIGRYGCMLLMVFNIGISEFGFPTPASFLVYLLSNTVLLLAYWVLWIVYAKRQTSFCTVMLAVLPTLIFLLCGVMLRHWLLVGFSVLFGVAHIYVCTHSDER